MKRKILNNNGSSIVEVLVGFVILLLFMGTLSQIIKLSSDMYMSSVDNIKSNTQFKAELYKKNSTSLSTNEYNTVKFTLESESGTELVLGNAKLEKITDSSGDKVVFKIK